MAAKKTAAKKVAKKSSAATAPRSYDTIGDVMRAASKGALPRGAKFELHSDRVVLVAGAHVLLNAHASEVARWGLRKLGFKADHAA